MTVDFDEIQGSPKFDYGPDGWTAVREGYTAWTDIDTFIAELLAPTITAGQTPIQGAPKSFPTNTNLRVANIHIEPELTSQTGPNANEDFETLISYQRAKWTIRYETQRGSFPNNENEALEEGDPVPFLSHRWSAGGEFLTLNNSGLEWSTDSGAVSEDVNAGLLIPTIEHQITWERVVRPPFNGIRATLGKVNEARGSFATGTIYKETLLFVGAELERQVMSDGKRAWKVAYRFSERAVEATDTGSDSIQAIVSGAVETTTIGGWNHFYRQLDGKTGFYRLAKKLEGDVTDAFIYPLANFAALFTKF